MLKRTWSQLTGQWKTLIEKPVTEVELGRVMAQASIPYFGFYLMLGLATVIATFGLLTNSAPAIIGAMIIAPLMAPILSASYGIVANDWGLFSRSIVTTVTGLILVIALAYLGTQVLGLRIAGSEILNRTQPTLLDLGVAMASGAAAAFAYSRHSIISSIAGVAIAVALVPPLAVTGIGLAQGLAVSADVGDSLNQLGLKGGGYEIAAGSFLLFLTNLSGIIVLAGIVFVSQGYGSRVKGVLSIVVVAVLSVWLLHPLGLSLNRLYVRSQVLSVFAELVHQNPTLFTQAARLQEISVDFREEVVHVSVTATAGHKNVPVVQDRLDLVQKKLTQSLERPVVIAARVVSLDVSNYRSGPGPADVDD